jgi:3-dehydroquinate synthase
MAENSLEKAREIINEVDAEMARLFKRRMEAVKTVAEYKKAAGLQVKDEKREAEVIRRGVNMLNDDELSDLYTRFLKNNIALYCEYQSRMFEEKENQTVNKIAFPIGGYDLFIGKDYIKRAKEFFKLDRKVLILTDSGVPEDYAKSVERCCKEAKILILPQGEGTKSLSVLEKILGVMQEFSMTRSDCVVAVGGGVVGDIGGFAASCYMRGIDFYNIPTTLLAQVDSSIGGKTAINFGGVKNSVGAFYQPKGVIIDTNLLCSLPLRHISNGLGEVIKMALTSDAELFDMLEKGDLLSYDLDKIIISAINIKKSIVEADQREAGLRRVLNFGHTLGHGIEASCDELYHGECISIGMIPFISPEIRERVRHLMRKNGISPGYGGDINEAIELVRLDKKRSGDSIRIIKVETIGSYEEVEISLDEFSDYVKKEML